MIKRSLSIVSPKLIKKTTNKSLAVIPNNLNKLSNIFGKIKDIKIKKPTLAGIKSTKTSSGLKNNFKSKRGRKSKFQSLIIEKDFEPENPKQLEQLDENTCKWPIGHPDEKSFYFCGRSSLKDFSYCKLHLLYAYQPKGKKEENTDRYKSGSNSVTTTYILVSLRTQDLHRIFFLSSILTFETLHP